MNEIALAEAPFFSLKRQNFLCRFFFLLTSMFAIQHFLKRLLKSNNNEFGSILTACISTSTSFFCKLLPEALFRHAV